MNRAPLAQGWFARSALEVAPDLVGCLLARRLPDGSVLRGLIVETEAYLGDDPACHAFAGKTARNATMFGPAGFSYVYFIYGMHFCLNAVTGKEGVGEAVLIRALDMTPAFPRREASGPGKLCRFLGIDKSFDAVPLFDVHSPLWVEPRLVDAVELTALPRIGISKAADRPWRWLLRDNGSVSTAKGGRKRKSGER